MMIVASDREAVGHASFNYGLFDACRGDEMKKMVKLR